MNKLKDFFINDHNILQISKGHHYFDIYDRHFLKYQNTNPQILEIGTAEGGGSELLNHYFDSKCNIVTIDINSPTNHDIYQFKNIMFVKGDQKDIEFLKQLKSTYQKFDIIIDDGGHGMDQQITSFNELYECLTEKGTYLIEDVHTSYWKNYNGGVNKPNTCIEFFKKMIDRLNTWHWQEPFSQNDLNFCKNTNSIHFYDSIIVIEKESTKNKPLCEGKQKHGQNKRIWDDNSSWVNNLCK